MIKQAIIPLAGLGTRLLPLTSVLPKELLPINGKPGLEYILSECIEAGIKEIIFVISNKKKISHFLKIRKQYAAMYDEVFRQIPELEILEIRDYAESAHHLYIIALRLEQLSITRDQFVDAIQSAGIGVAIHYQPLHLQPFYKKELNNNYLN